LTSSALFGWSAIDEPRCSGWRNPNGARVDRRSRSLGRLAPIRSDAYCRAVSRLVLVLAAAALLLPASADARRLPRLLTQADSRHFSLRPPWVGYTGDGSGFLGGWDRTEAHPWGRLYWVDWTQRRARAHGVDWVKTGWRHPPYRPHRMHVEARRPRHGRFTMLRIRRREPGGVVRIRGVLHYTPSTEFGPGAWSWDYRSVDYR
jgi:hypothetical protein